MIIVATREAVRGVPQEIRHAALAVGATKWQTTQHHVLPYALPGVVTGVIIGISRALGETAPLIMIGGLTFVAFLPITRPGDAAFETIGAARRIRRAGERRMRSSASASSMTASSCCRTSPNMPVASGTDLRAAARLDRAVRRHMGRRGRELVADAIGSAQEFTVMPIQMFNWTSRPQAEFLEIAAAAGLVLLAITLLAERHGDLAALPAAQKHQVVALGACKPTLLLRALRASARERRRSLARARRSRSLCQKRRPLSFGSGSRLRRKSSAHARQEYFSANARASSRFSFSASRQAFCRSLSTMPAPVPGRMSCGPGAT